MLNRLNSKIRVLLFMFELRLLNISRLIFTSMNWNCRKKIGKTSANFLLKRLNSHSMSRHQQKCHDTKFQKFPQCRDTSRHCLNVVTSDFKCCNIANIQEHIQSLSRHRKDTRATPRLTLKQCRDIKSMSRHYIFNVATSRKAN